ncbi:sentrin-specific protease 8-like [Ruditapes philippinarum]|uniref:sentrin-specific protease 8-like n=1 Tax=Ruditapes philippinarum TaxID=129788 RepID=UPI00295C23C0|nr:sentrin-specific protease 8-like [Ruditapes philippinarum]
MAAENDNCVVVSFNDSLIHQSDVDLLDGPNWINDNLINFCFEYFEKEQFNHSADKLALISPDVVQFIKLAPDDELGEFLKPLNLPSKEFIFLPVNDNQVSNQAGGTHWSLLVYVRNKQEFRHYDSMECTNKEIAKILAYKVQPYFQAPRGRMKVIEVDSPKQKNSFDCGVYVISIAEHLCKELCEGYNIPLNDLVNSESVSKKRSQIKDLIYHVAEEFGT